MRGSAHWAQLFRFEPRSSSEGGAPHKLYTTYTHLKVRSDLDCKCVHGSLAEWVDQPGALL